MPTNATTAHVIALVIVFTLTLIVRGNLKDAFDAALHMIVEWILLDAIVAALTIVALCR